MANMLKVDCDKIKEARKNIGKSQAQMAKAINVSLSTYRKYEYGERIPPLHIARKMAMKLNIEVADIYSNSEDLLFQIIKIPNDNITITTPYKYNYWHNEKFVELIYPDNTKISIPINDLFDAERKIHNFIDKTFIQLKQNQERKD